MPFFSLDIVKKDVNGLGKVVPMLSKSNRVMKSFYVMNRES